MNSPLHVRSFHTLWSLGLLIAASLSAGGCTDSFIDPYENDDKYFTVYGFLDQSKNFQPGAEHIVRVIPVTRLPERIETPTQPQASIDARVFSTDLTTNETVEWRHSLERLDNGLYGHLFRARFFVQANHVYRLEVVRSDGITAHAETHVPSLASVEPERGQPAISADSSVITQTLILPALSSVWDVDLIYHVDGPGCFTASQVGVPYGRVGRPIDGGWTFDAELSGDMRRISEQFGSTAFLCAMGIRAKVMDGAWRFSEGELDLEALAQPDALTNVENGYGFFGSVGLLQYDWPVSEELRTLLAGAVQ